MPSDKPEYDSFAQRQRALSSWDNEGGAAGPAPIQTHADLPELTNAELVQLRIRLIALENLVIGLLAGGSDRQFSAAREMATYISPRSGSTHHPLTVQASKHMTDLAERAFYFRDASSS
jgi:hypothetical protein